VSRRVMEGDGSMRFRFGRADRDLMVGLSDNNSDRGYGSVDFSIYALSNGYYEIRRSGAVKTGQILYTSEDVFEIERLGSTIYFYQNGEMVWTEDAVGYGTLQVDLSMYQQDGLIEDVRLRGAVREGDIDEDGMLDEAEYLIISSNETDDIEDLFDVEPGEDFDEDGISNVVETWDWSNPADENDVRSFRTVEWEYPQYIEEVESVAGMQAS